MSRAPRCSKSAGCAGEPVQWILWSDVGDPLLWPRCAAHPWSTDRVGVVELSRDEAVVWEILSS